MRQIFLSKESIDLDKKIAIAADDSFHHLIHVLRKQKGDIVQVFDGQGGLYRARIADIGQNKVSLEILESSITPPKENFILTLAVAMLKGKSMHWLVQKVTEIGVNTIIPLITPPGIGLFGVACGKKVLAQQLPVVLIDLAA